MTAILKHELKSYFHSLTAYVFGAFLLVMVGFGSVYYNLMAAVSNFEYVLSFGSIIFVIIVPLLTMRVIAEERRQKTDQLLYSLPVTTTQVVLGKYLALLAVYLVPLGIISTYPLIFSRYGEVYLPTSYGSLFAIFVMAPLSSHVGVFLSSLTENQAWWRYYRGSDPLQLLQRRLVRICTTTILGTLAALVVLALILGGIIQALSPAAM